MALTKSDLQAIDGLIVKRIKPLENGQATLGKKQSGLENGLVKLEKGYANLEKGQANLQKSLNSIKSDLKRIEKKINYSINVLVKNQLELKKKVDFYHPEI